MSAEDRKFIECLKKPPQVRTEQDQAMILAYLHSMEALANLREPALRALCSTVRYEWHDANEIIYCQGELALCWYILLSGSVFIEGSMFLPRSSLMEGFLYSLKSWKHLWAMLIGMPHSVLEI